MNNRILLERVGSLALLLLMIVALSISFVTSYTLAQAQQIPPGPASDQITYRRVTIDTVVPEFQKGTLDGYLFAIKPTQLDQFQPLITANIIKFVQAPTGLVDFIFNPAPVKEIALDGDQRGKYLPALIGYPESVITQVYYDPETNKTYVDICCDGKNINPLALQQVRFALNYAIDRDYVVKSIYRGYATPMYTFLSKYDPDYLLIADIVAKYQFRYDLSYADQLITQALTAVGAYKVGGKWYYAGNPITLTFIIRTEDERKEIGDLFASALESLGFTVNREYLTFGEAISRVYNSNPTDFLWHIYTEGWSRTAITRYDSTSINQFCAPWYGYMPGWQTPGWWWFRDDVMDEIGMKIYFGQFTSKDERDSLYRSGVETCIKDAVRVWVANRIDLYPVSANLQGVTQDLGAGFTSLFNPREIFIPGKSSLTIGNLWVYTTNTIWNVYGGFTDVYSVDIMYATADPFTWTHPFNGEPIPFRVSYTVETAGPTGTLTVPSDAFIWDAKTGRWVFVPNGTKAISVVYFDMSKFIGAKWHDNVTITWGDVLGNLAFWFDLVYNSTKSSIESSIAAINKPFFDTIKGFRIDENRKILEVYVDYWHFDPNYIASYATITDYNPAELLYIQNMLVFDLQKYTFSTTASQVFKRPVLNLVLPDVAKDIKAAIPLASSVPSRFFTLPNGKSYMTQDEWSLRLQALSSWIDAHGHAWISQGPFYLDSFDPTNQVAVIKAFRDPTYPFKKGDWYFGIPIPTQILNVATPTLVIGQPFTVNVTVAGVPPLVVKYVVTEVQTGTIITVGMATNITPNIFVFQLPTDITVRLKPYYLYQIQILAFSENVAIPDATTISLEAIPASAQQFNEAMQRALQELANSTAEQISSVANSTAQQINAIRAEFESRLGALAATLSSALSSLSTSLSESLSTLSNTFSRSISDLSGALNATNQQLTSQINTLNNRLNSVSSDLSARIDTLSSSVSNVQNTVSSIVPLVYGVLGLSLVNLVLIIILLFRRK
ncbi:MAG: ABC transporter substrate-binding protein [Sulfolobales archaeon]